MRTAHRARSAAGSAAPLVPVGISTGTYITTLDSTGMDQVLDAIVGLNAKWVRETIAWPFIQPTNSSTFDWSLWDLFVSKCNARSLKIVACVGGSPAWARPTHSTAPVTSPPDSAATFGTFCAAAAARYSASIHHWEVWNEPNQPTYWGGTSGTPRDSDPAEYTALLVAAYNAIKGVDPSAVILGGSFTPAPDGAGPDGLYISPAVFLDGMLAAGAAAYMDGVAHHPYSYPLTPSDYASYSAWSQMADTTPSLLSVMASHGVSRKLWLTEVGAPTYGPSLGVDYVSEAVQAEIVDEAVRAVRANPSRFGGIFVYTIVDRAAPGVDTDREKHFGVLESTGTYKDAATALVAAIAATGGAG